MRQNRRNSALSYMSGISIESVNELKEETIIQNEVELMNQAKIKKYQKNRNQKKINEDMNQQEQDELNVTNDKVLLRQFFVNITVVPMALAVIILGITVYIMMRFYFDLMMENSASMILKEIVLL